MKKAKEKLVSELQSGKEVVIHRGQGEGYVHISKDKKQELFNYFADEYDIFLMESDFYEIENILK